MLSRTAVPLLLTLALAVSGCSLAGGPGGNTALAQSDLARTSANPTAAHGAGSAINAFGLDLYRQLASGAGNLVFSPASIAIALSMARAGARGETAAQMDSVLRSIGADAQADAINALDAALAARNGSFSDVNGKLLDVTLRIANAPFAQRDMVFTPAYLDALAARFGAGVRLVDYKADPEAARKLINAWVSDQTAKRIPELLAAGSIDQMTRLALVNAIYLKAPWQRPFNVHNTQPAPFTRTDGIAVSVPMMAAGAQSLAYAAAGGCGGIVACPALGDSRDDTGSGWQAVDLPYVGGSLVMTLILPDNIATFERGFDADAYSAIVKALSSKEVILSLPAFNIQTATDLASQLSAPPGQHQRRREGHRGGCCHGGNDGRHCDARRHGHAYPGSAVPVRSA